MTAPNTAPAVSGSWDRIEAWLGAHAPHTLATLRPPADPAEVRAAADRLGVAFPDDLAASLARHDGTVPGAPGRFSLGAAEHLSALETMVQRTESILRALRNIEGDLLGGHYWHRQFVQVTDSSNADALVVDCRPGAAFGAIGSFFNGEGTTFGLWPSFAALLAALADSLENGTAFRGAVPVAFGGRLAWERARDELPEPPSLFELAAAHDPRHAEPAGARPRRTPRFEPVPEAGWVGEYPGFCLTFARGIDAAELLRRYGALPESVAPRSRDEAREAAETWTNGYLATVRAGVAGAWAFGFEEATARQGIRAEVLRRLSAGTRAVCVNYARRVHLTVFDDGVRTTEYNTLQPDLRLGATPDLLARALREAGLLPLDLTRYPDEDVYAVLDVLATEFGIGFDSSALDTVLLSARILPVLADIQQRAVMSPRAEPQIAALIACAADDRLRAALSAQNRRLAAETGLDRYPEVAEALDRAEAGEVWTVSDESPLGLRLRRVAAEAGAAVASRTDLAARGLLTEPERQAWMRRNSAGNALRAVVGQPPREAAFAVLNQRRAADWRAQFAEDLGEVEVPEGTAERLQEAETREFEEARARAPRHQLNLAHTQRPQRSQSLRPGAPRAVRDGSGVLQMPGRGQSARLDPAVPGTAGVRRGSVRRSVESQPPEQPPQQPTES